MYAALLMVLVCEALCVFYIQDTQLFLSHSHFSLSLSLSLSISLLSLSLSLSLSRSLAQDAAHESGGVEDGAIAGGVSRRMKGSELAAALLFRQVCTTYADVC